ncbi:MAG: hypothetical protein KDI63_05190 [Gammaproteobacteria bacterium]|nr:hypothetical protein [Gammaproteobacteria bacterium]
MTEFKAIVLLILISATTVYADANRYRPMAESMFDMMDAFSTAYQNRQGHRETSSSAWPGVSSGWAQTPSQWGNSLPMSPGGPQWWMYGSQMFPGSGWNSYLPGPYAPGFPTGQMWPSPAAVPYVTQSSPLNGAWLGQTGERLLIRDGRFHLSRYTRGSREGYLRILDSSRVLLTPSSGGNAVAYEYAIKDDRLVLRDPQLNLLLFRRAEGR